VIADRVDAARARLERAGIATGEARLDARLLAQRALGWSEIDFLTRAREAAPGDFAGAFERLVARRERREPLAYILGERHFWSRTFAVSHAVLVPRPETELIIEAAMELPPPGRAADVGTGSGCLAVTLACERPEAHIVATDLSEAALSVAAANAERHDVCSTPRTVRST
jgi:release factor glutamine methyltransferase